MQRGWEESRKQKANKDRKGKRKRENETSRE
jgi:hypothetical protein